MDDSEPIEKSRLHVDAFADEVFASTIASLVYLDRE